MRVGTGGRRVQEETTEGDLAEGVRKLIKRAYWRGKMARKSPEENGKRLAFGLAADCPRIYLNGFVNGVGVADMVVVAEQNGKPTAILNMSFTTAKTLAIALSESVAKIEEATGQTMLTTDEVEKAMTNETSDDKSE